MTFDYKVADISLSHEETAYDEDNDNRHFERSQADMNRAAHLYLAVMNG